MDPLAQTHAGWTVERIATECGAEDVLFALTHTAERTELPLPLQAITTSDRAAKRIASGAIGFVHADDQASAVEAYAAAAARDGHAVTIVARLAADDESPRAGPDAYDTRFVSIINVGEEAGCLVVRVHLDHPDDRPLFRSGSQVLAGEALGATMVQSHRGVIASVSPELAALLGVQAEQLVGQQMSRFVHPADLAIGVSHWITNRDQPGASWTARQRIRHGDGSWRLFEIHCETTLDRASHLTVVSRWNDLTAELHLSDAIRRSEARFRTLAQSLPAAVMTTTVDGSDFWANERFWEMTGQPPDTFDPLTWAEFVHPEDRAEWDRVASSVLAGGDAEHEYRFVHTDGSIRNGHIQIRVIEDDLGGEPRVVCCLFDVTDQRRTETLLEWQATHDPLTGLANRTEALDRLAAHLGVPGSAVALLFLDLDDFKDVNDRFGHDRGDLLLQAVATRVSGLLRPADLLARLGGDEFLVICPGVSDHDSALRIANRIMADLVEVISIDGAELRPSASIGIAIGHSDGQNDPFSLIRDADTAMYEAKRRGRRRVELFGSALRRRVLDRLEIEGELRDAFGSGQLRPHYQPIVDARTGELYGLESLVRWQHPTRGLLAPGHFLGVAAGSGLSEQVDREMLRAVMTETAGPLPGLRARFPLVRIGVNLSGASVANAETPGFILELAASKGFDLRCLTVEVTESDLIDNLDGAVENLERLRSVGIAVALDDFGVGYSSLTYLRQIPADHVKLDQSFVRTLDDDVSSRIIAGSVVDMSHRLGLSVVAEGVETQVHLDEVRAIDVDSVQGYGIAHPTPLPAAIAAADDALRVIGRDRRAALPAPARSDR